MAPAEIPRTVTVRQLNDLVRCKLDKDPELTDVAVEGEVSGWKPNKSGHVYFSLKDESARISCVMFAFKRRMLQFHPQDGDLVMIIGKVSIYVSGGEFQLIADMIVPLGVGLLQQQYERLKKKLEAEGLFSQDRKKVLPHIPGAIGVVTSPTGAAIHDIIRVARNRNKGVKIYLYPAQVQGEGAADSIIKGIHFFNTHNLVDVLIVGRGGGSYEDLWCFNDEKLIRAIAESELPVVSAVGHEVDVTLCDFVADVRAATPSNGAELVVADVSSDERQLKLCDDKLRYMMKRLLEQSENAVASNEVALFNSFEKIVEEKENTFGLVLTGLEKLSPLKVMLRGYSVAKANDSVLKSVNQVGWGDYMETYLGDGKIVSVVQEVKNG